MDGLFFIIQFRKPRELSNICLLDGNVVVSEWMIVYVIFWGKSKFNSTKVLLPVPFHNFQLSCEKESFRPVDLCIAVL